MSNPEYIVLCGQIVGGDDRGFSTEYSFDGKRFADRERAIDHGFDLGRSDDFNIGVIENGKLVSIDWMHRPIDRNGVRLARIADQIFLAQR